MLDLRPTAQSEVELRFLTGDVCDVLFRNHCPLRTVAEVELEGSQNIVIGIHHAIKYRSLAAAESMISLDDREELAAHVISYKPGDQEALDFARKYNVELHTLDRNTVLAPG